MKGRPSRHSCLSEATQALEGTSMHCNECPGRLGIVWQEAEEGRVSSGGGVCAVGSRGKALSIS